MTIKLYPIFNTALFLLLLVWCALLNAAKIDLTTADLGRHLINGFVILHGSAAQVWGVLHTNFYSYTNANFPFINHHWLGGIFLYLVYRLGGFNLLSIVYVGLTVLTFAVFLFVAQKRSNMVVAGLVGVLLMPILASRKEVRPEVFTYLFSGIYYLILNNFSRPMIADEPAPPASQGGSARYSRLLYLLPLIMLFWVNLHIGFIMGIGIIGVFWVEAIIKYLFFKFRPHLSRSTKDNSDESGHLLLARRRGITRLQFLTIILVLTGLATLVNPSFIKGAVYPLIIFRHYGYMVLENQSVLFLVNLHHTAGLYFGLFGIMAGVTFLSFVAVFVWQRSKFFLPDFLLFLTFALMATWAIRDFPMFGFFAVPILSANISTFLPRLPTGLYRKCVGGLVLVIILGALVRYNQQLNYSSEEFGIGLMPGVSDAADFYLSNKISGPIFNNYDIGGYLIFNLYNLRAADPSAEASAKADKSANYSESVFVDNRPEAYPVSFFQHEYIPMQEDEAKWQQGDSKYNFNAIFFDYRDLTPWAQAFLIKRVQDPAWAPVYADSYNIIFLKRNQANVTLIQRYEIPKSHFGITRN